jgi:signal transduction histidine kinase
MPGHQIVGAMIERIDTLAARVKDILLFAGTRDPRLQAVDVGPLLQEVVGSAAAAVRNVAAANVSGTAATVTADPEMLRELLLNLVINACQAASCDASQPVRVEVSAANDVCHIDVLDRGPGIDPAIRNRIFEPFFTTKHGGTGLGLAIVKRLVDLQGGAVTLSDRAGGGACARVTLPVHRR